MAQKKRPKIHIRFSHGSPLLKVMLIVTLIVCDAAFFLFLFRMLIFLRQCALQSPVRSLLICSAEYRPPP